MGIFDPAVESGALGDRDGCWTFIRRFTAAWLEPLGPGDGDSCAAIAAVEQRLLVPLPAAVHEAYALFGRRDDLTRNEHGMRRLDQLDFRSPHDPHMLVFRVAGQGAFHWGIRLADLHLDDPPVMVRTDMRGWFRYLERFSLAAVELVLYETVVGEGMYLAMCDYDDALAARVTEQYAALKLPPVPADEDDPAGRVHWYGGPDVLVSLQGHAAVWVCGRSEQTLAEAIRPLPGRWYHFF